jgi:hypothetical protein
MALMIGNGFVLAGLIGGGLVFWLFLCAIRRKIRAGSARDQKTQARATPALLGAMFGFPAGLWIYDKLYPCPPPCNEQLSEPEA